MKLKRLIAAVLFVAGIVTLLIAQSGRATERSMRQCDNQQNGTVPQSTPSVGDCENTYLPAVIVEDTQIPTPTIESSSTPRPTATEIPPTHTSTPTATFTPTATPTPIPQFPFYGMQFVPEEDLQTVKSFGTEVVLQTFFRNSPPEDWISYLDAAEAADIKVVASFWQPGWTYDGEQWIIDDEVKAFIKLVEDHPALFAIYSIHEPYWNGCFGCGYTTAEVQQLYSAIKEIADVPIFADMDELVFWAERSEENVFADAICDYCGLWYYPATTDGTFDRE